MRLQRSGQAALWRNDPGGACRNRGLAPAASSKREKLSLFAIRLDPRKRSSGMSVRSPTPGSPDGQLGWGGAVREGPVSDRRAPVESEYVLAPSLTVGLLTLNQA